MSALKKYIHKPVELLAAQATRENEQDICEKFEAHDMPHMHGADDIMFALLPREGAVVALVTGQAEYVKVGEYIIFHDDNTVTVCSEQLFHEEYEAVPSALTPEELRLQEVFEDKA